MWFETKPTPYSTREGTDERREKKKEEEEKEAEEEEEEAWLLYIDDQTSATSSLVSHPSAVGIDLMIFFWT